MNISCTHTKSGTHLSVEGELNIYSVAQAKQALFNDYEKFTSPVSLDLHNVSEFDTAGLQLLLFMQKVLLNDNKKIHITKSNEHVDSILTTLDVATSFSLGN